MIKSVFAILKGMNVVFKHLFKKPVTLEYPEVKPQVPMSHRGKQVLKGCIGCGICKQVCPANAISFEKDGAKVCSYTIDLNKCIFCGQCQYYCPVGAIKHTAEFELASSQKESLILNLLEQKKEVEEC